MPDAKVAGGGLKESVCVCVLRQLGGLTAVGPQRNLVASGKRII